jgi:hypothetical protein
MGFTVVRDPRGVPPLSCDLEGESASQLAAEYRIVWPRSILRGYGPANSPMPSCISPTANSMRIEAERVRQVRLRRGFLKAARPMVSCTAIIRGESRRHPNGAGLFHQRRRSRKPSPCLVFLRFLKRPGEKLASVPCAHTVCPKRVASRRYKALATLHLASKATVYTGVAFTAPLSSVFV